MKMLFLSFLFSFVFPVSQLTDYQPVDADNAVVFTIKNMGINTHGELKGLAGTIRWDAANPANSSMNVSVNVSSINTGIEMRDKHLKTADYFDAEKYPRISFRSTSINDQTVTGILTIKNTSKTISFPYSVKKQKAGYLFSGNFSINRKDYDLGGSFSTIGNNVDVQLNVLAK